MSDIVTNAASAVTDTVSNVASAPVNVISGVGKDITSTPFYKNPILYTFVIYIVLLSGFVVYYKKDNLMKYLFGKNSNISLGGILKFPYGYDKPQNIIKTFFSNPITLYVVLFTVLMTSFVDTTKTGLQPYYYSVMFGVLIQFMLFLAHVGIFKYLIGSETIEVSEEYSIKKKGNTYSTLFRGFWYLLFFLSPIYSFIVVYLSRKL